ncbi:hypothetical protein SO802_005885 [Lithocarpus litseifolius]|uniref:RNase H type-1 domain-containing protein n=1 Tax=Lithocarpus litseifolius TaxID=425828 RepID=A0AAW2DJD2_9ROSI
MGLQLGWRIYNEIGIIVTRNYSRQSSGLYGIGEIISGWYQVNYNGAEFDKDNSVGLDVVIRNDKVPLPTMVIEVETLAARRAFELALELGFDNIVLEGDLEVSHQSPKERHQFFGSLWT